MTNTVVCAVLLAAGGLYAGTADWETRMQIANKLEADGKFQEAGAAYQSAVEDSKSFDASDWRRAQALSNYAAHLAGRGRHSEAAEAYRDAISAWKASGQTTHLGITTCNLAVLYRTTGHYADAARAAEEGVRVLTEVSPEPSAALATCWNNLAEAYRYAQDLKRAETAARKAAAVAAAGGPRDGRVGNALHTLGNVLQTAGRTDEALDAYRKALDIRREAFGPEHPFVAATLSSMASALTASGRAAEAEPLARDAVRITEQVYGPEHGQMIGPLNNLGQCLRLLGRTVEAEPLYRRALRISAAWHGKNHPDHAKVMANFAEYLRDTGRLRASAEVYEAAAAVLTSSLGKDHPLVVTVHLSLADVYARMDRMTEAKALYRDWGGSAMALTAARPPAPPSR